MSEHPETFEELFAPAEVKKAWAYDERILKLSKHAKKISYNKFLTWFNKKYVQKDIHAFSYIKKKLDAQTIKQIYDKLRGINHE